MWSIKGGWVECMFARTIVMMVMVMMMVMMKAVTIVTQTNTHTHTVQNTYYHTHHHHPYPPPMFWFDLVQPEKLDQQCMMICRHMSEIAGKHFHEQAHFLSAYCFG